MGSSWTTTKTPAPSPRGRGRSGGACAVFVVLVAGCGGGSGHADVRKAVDAYSQAFLSGNATAAYGMLSTRCQGQVTAGQFGAVVASAKALYGPQPVTSFKVDDASSSTAHVTYGYATAKLDQTRQAWVKQSGAWRWDGC
jgi:hypothetical protein